jgi:hypothetical protein
MCFKLPESQDEHHFVDLRRHYSSSREHTQNTNGARDTGIHEYGSLVKKTKRSPRSSDARHRVDNEHPLNMGIARSAMKVKRRDQRCVSTTLIRSLLSLLRHLTSFGVCSKCRVSGAKSTTDTILEQFPIAVSGHS